MRWQILGPLATIIFIAFLFASEAEARRDETLLYVGWAGLVGGSTATFIYNTVGPPSDGWIAAGGLLGIVNLPIGTILIGGGLMYDSPGAIGIGAMHLVLGGLNLLASLEAGEAQEKSTKFEETQCFNLEVNVASVNPSIQVALRW